MKKILGIGAASLALAALPVVGVFAAEGVTRTDTLTVTVEKGCSFAASASDGINTTVTLGQGTKAQDIEGVKFNVTCNGTNDGTWELKASGENQAQLSDGAGNNISSTDGTLDGTTSNWAFRVSAQGGAQVEAGYDAYKEIPKTATKVAGNSSAAATEDATVQAFYGVSSSDSQAAGTYTGHVVYTLTNVPAN